MVEEEEEIKNIHPSLPPNYVSLVLLQEQWQKRKQKEEEEEKRKQIEREIKQKNREIVGEKRIGQSQKFQREGNYVRRSTDVEKSKPGRVEREKQKNNQEIGGEKEIGQFQKIQREGNDVKNRRNVEKIELGRFEREKEKNNQEIGQFQQHQREGNCVKNSRDLEKLKLGWVERETEQKNQEIGQFQQDQMEVNYVKSSRDAGKSKLGRFQGSDGSGYNKRRSCNGNQDDGVHKDKGKGKIGEVGGSQGDSVLHRREERCDGKVRRNGGGGVGSEVSMSGCVVAVEDDEIAGIKKPEDGLRRNVGDLRENYVVSKGLPKGKTKAETKKGLGGNELDHEATRVGHRKKDLSRPSRGNKGALVVNGGDSDVGKREGVEEKEEVLEGTDNARISDMGIATEIKNVEEKNRGGYKKSFSKKRPSRRRFKGGTEQGQGNGGCMAEEKGIQLDLETKNGENNGEERSGDNIGDDEDVSEKVARLRERKHNRVSVGRRNLNGRVMEGTRWGYTIWAVKGDDAGSNMITNTVGEKFSNNESVEKIPVTESEMNAITDIRSDRSQRNACDNIVNGEFQDNIMEKKENHKHELFGEQTEDNGMLMTNEATNGVGVKFRDEYRGNWDKKRFSRENIRRDFKELSLNSRKVVGNAICNVQMYGSNGKFQKGPRFVDKHRNNGLVWVKKGDIADADVSET